MADHDDLGFVPTADNSHDDLGFQPTPTQQQEEPSVTHSFLNAVSNPFGIEPVVQGGLEASGQAIKDLVNKGSLNIGDIAKKYQEARDKEREENEMSAKANPTANLAGELTGGVLVGGALPLPEAAEGAKLGARMLNASKIGAGYGAATGLGQSLSAGNDLPTTAKNVGFGGATGSLIGPLVEIGTTGLKAGGSYVGNEIADTDTYQKFMKSLGYGLDKVNLTSKAGAKAAQEGVEDAAENLGMSARDLNKQAGAEVGAAKQALQDSDRTFDVTDKINKLESAISNLRKSSNPNADKDADFLQKYLDNLTLGKEKEVPYSTLNYNKPISSSVDKLEAKAALERAKGIALGQDVDTNIGQVTDEESGNPFDVLVKKLGKKQSATALPSTPEQELSTIPGNLNSKTVRTGGINPESVDFATANDINKALTDFGGVSGNGPELKTTDALNTSKLVGQDLKTQLTGAVPDEAEGPMTQLQSANQKATASYKALNALGIDDSNFEISPLTGERILTPQGEAKLANTVRQIGRGTDTQSGQNATNRLDTALDYLKSINPDKGSELEQQVKKAGDIYNLVQQGQGNTFSKSGFLKSLPIQAGNRIGRFASTPVETLKGVINASKAGVSEASQKISTAIQPLTDTAFGQAAKNLVSSGTGIGMKLGSELAKAIGKDNSQKNAILFSLMQNPNYREELQKHFSSEESQ